MRDIKISLVLISIMNMAKYLNMLHLGYFRPQTYDMLINDLNLHGVHAIPY